MIPSYNLVRIHERDENDNLHWNIILIKGQVKQKIHQTNTLEQAEAVMSYIRSISSAPTEMERDYMADCERLWGVIPVA